MDMAWLYIKDPKTSEGLTITVKEVLLNPPPPKKKKIEIFIYWKTLKQILFGEVIAEFYLLMSTSLILT